MKDIILQSFLEGIRPYRKGIRAIYLFGSRARRDHLPDSDYDILLVTHEKDRVLKDKIYDVVTDVALESRCDMSLKFFAAAEFDRLKAIPSHFIQSVLTEGVRIG